MKKKDEAASAKQASALTAVMAAALLFLSAVLARSAVVQLQAAKIVTGCISIVGAVLFLGVSATMLGDLRKLRKQNSKPQED